MQLALANSALPAGTPQLWLPRLAEAGVHGLEVAAGATWPAAQGMPSAAAVAAYRRMVEAAGLTVLGLRLSLAEQPGLAWLADAAARERTAAWLVRMSALCRDLGGQMLSIADGRWRQGLSVAQAWRVSVDFFQELLPRLEAHGTLLSLAPQAPGSGDFCTSANDCRILADAIDHPAFALQISAAALAASGESGRHSVFAAHYGRLELFVADEPGLLPLGTSGRVDHAAMRRHLAAGGYRGWVCLHQQGSDSLDESLRFLREHYLRRDNLSLLLHRQRQQAVC